MSRSNRGAARVSAIWIIVVGVVALATTAFAFITQSDLTRAEKQAAAAKVSEKSAVDAFQEVNTRRQKVVEKLGHYDKNSADPVADLDAAAEAISGLRSTWPDISATAGSYQEMIPEIKLAYNNQGKTIVDLKADVARLNSELSAKNDALASVTRDKDSKIQSLTQQLADQTQNAEQRAQDLQSTIDDGRDAVASTDQALRDAQSQFATKEADMQAIAVLQGAQNGSLMHDLSLRVHADNMRSDGEILAVAGGAGQAWINRGSDDRLTVGTRFEIRGVRGGLETLKAVGQVVRIVDAGMAELRLSGMSSSDPVVVGDSIINPFYDPDNVRKAVLIGEFAGRDQLVANLANMNIIVEDELSIDSRLVIIGGPQRVDPETGDALDEELKPEDTAAYKEAVAKNLQRMTVAQLREYFPQTL